MTQQHRAVFWIEVKTLAEIRSNQLCPLALFQYVVWTDCLVLFDLVLVCYFNLSSLFVSHLCFSFLLNEMLLLQYWFQLEFNHRNLDAQCGRSPSPYVSALGTVWVAPPDASSPPSESSPRSPSPMMAADWLKVKQSSPPSHTNTL